MPDHPSEEKIRQHALEIEVRAWLGVFGLVASSCASPLPIADLGSSRLLPHPQNLHRAVADLARQATQHHADPTQTKKRRLELNELLTRQMIALDNVDVGGVPTIR